MYTDAHCHLTHPDWETHLVTALANAKTAGISHWIAGGIDPKEWKSQKELAARYPLSLVFGLHPWWVAKATLAEITQGLKLLEEALPQVVALGELGLDHHFFAGAAEKEKQRFAFEAQLDLAKAAKKPIVLHAVKAHAECEKALKEKNGSWRGLVHRFQGSIEEAAAYLQLGLTLSIGGPGLDKKAKSSASLWRSIPAERLVLETDAPWDKRFGVALPDQLSALNAIAEVVAEARGETQESLLRQSTENLKRLL